MNHRVLVVYPKESKHINAWLSVNGKSRWTKKSAEYHAQRIRDNKTMLTGWNKIIVKKIDATL